MSLRFTIAVTVTLAAALSAPACASDACRLLTKSDVESVIKAKVQSMKPLGPEAGCQYMLAGKSLFPGTVSLQLHSASRSDYDEYLRKSASELKAKISPIGGLGEKAAWDGGRVIVYAKKQLWVFTGGLPGMSAQDQRARLVVLAKRSLARS